MADTKISAFPSKATAVGADIVDILDSDSANANSRTTVAGVVNSTTVDAAGAVMTDDASLEGYTWFIDQDDLSTNSATLAPSQQSVKAYIDALTVPIGIAASDETTDLTTGTGKATFRMPFAMTLTEVRCNVNTAPVGSTIIVDINEDGTTILSTKLTIDASEKTSETAATPAVISDSAIADDAEITIDIDQIGSSTAGKGLKVWLIGTRA